ncbi:hypothetical protein [Streptococcus infantarius]|uniref:hypothetical protein n=1 Tax=Streptococcus infantarius TaxID=102684 RepID=UPI0022DEDB12|nr:hypothetical protein [Streptococcus infantarius]
MSKNNVRIAIRDSTDSHNVAFFDNKAGIKYKSANLHRFLAGSASILTIKYNSKDIDRIRSGCKLAFRYKARDYWLNVMSFEKKGFEVELTAYSLGLELNNETRGEHKPANAMSIAEYVAYYDPEHALTIGVNEVSDKRIKLEWTGTDTILARLFSVANSFGAELDFNVELNDDYSLKRQVLNIYKKGNLGTNKVSQPVRVGKELKVINYSDNIKELRTAVRATGKDGLTIDGLNKKIYDNNKELLYYSSGMTVYAPQSRDRFPSVGKGSNDNWIVEDLGETQYETKDSLWGYLYSEIQKKSLPEITYEVEGAIDAGIGDTQILIDDVHYDPALYVQARVSELEDDILTGKVTKSTFINFERKYSQIADSLLKQVEALAEDAAPYIVRLSTDNGYNFKNGQGTSTITAKLEKYSKIVNANWKWLINNSIVSETSSVTINASQVTGTLNVVAVASVDGNEVAREYITFTNSDDGVGIKSIKRYYTTNDQAEGVTAGGQNWSTKPTTVTADKNYMWSYDVITYTNDTSLVTEPAVIGARGDDGLDADTTGITEALDKAKQELTALSANIEKVRDDSLAAVNEAKQQLAAVANDLSTAKQDLQAQASQLTEQASAQSELTKRVSTVEETANGTKTTVSELSKTVDSNTKNITSVTARTKTVEDDLTSTKTTLSQVKTTAENTSKKTATLETGLDGVKADLATTTVTADTTKTNLANYQASNDNVVANLQSNLQTANGNISSLQTKVEAVPGQITSAVSAVESKIPTSIGGRNLWIQSKATGGFVEETLPDNHITGQKKCYRITNNAEIKFNIEPDFSPRLYRTVTFSAWVKYENVVQGANSWNVFNCFKHEMYWKNSSTGLTSSIDYTTLKGFTGTSDWKYVTYTYDYAANKSYDQLKTTIRFNLESVKSGTAWVTGVKIEVGSIPSDYSPAQEDTESDINAVSSQIKQTADGIALLATKTELNAAKSDLQNGISTATSKADNAQSTANSNAQTISTHTTQISALNTGLQAKVSQSDFNTLSGRVTTAESNLTAKANELSSKITSVEGKIPTSIDTVNLIKGTGSAFVMGFGITNTTWDETKKQSILDFSISGVRRDIEDEILPQGNGIFDFKPIKGTTYTQSIMIDTDATFNPNGQAQCSWFTYSGGHNQQKAYIKQIGQYSYQVWSTYTWNSESTVLRAFDWYNLHNVLLFRTTGTYLAFYKPKLTTGNLPSDWSPSPEDYDSKLATAQSEIKQTTDAITASVSSVQTAASNAQSTANTAVSKADAAQAGVNTLDSTTVKTATLNLDNNGFVTKVGKTVNGNTFATMIAQNESDVQIIAKKMKVSGDMIVNGAITAEKLNINSLSALSAKLGDVTSGSITNAFSSGTRSGSIKIKDNIEITSTDTSNLLPEKAKENLELSTGSLAMNASTLSDEATHSMLIMPERIKYTKNNYDTTRGGTNSWSLTHNGYYSMLQVDMVWQNVRINNTSNLMFGVSANFIRIGNLVTISVNRQIKNIITVAENELALETIPKGFRPITQAHLTLTGNTGSTIDATCICHLNPDGTIRFTNNKADNRVWSGTVTYTCVEPMPYVKDLNNGYTI